MENSKRGIIYCVENLDNGKKYIGCTVNFGRRIDNHLKDALNGKSTLAFYDDLKANPDRFVFKILEMKILVSDLKKKESEWIAKLNTVQQGYNLVIRSGNEQLSLELVKVIQEELAYEVVKFQDIANKYEVKLSCVYDINTGRSWYCEDLEYPLRKTSKQKRKMSLEELKNICNLLSENNLSFQEIATLNGWKSQSVLRKINNGTYSINLYPKEKYPLRPVDSRKGSRNK